MVTEFPNETVGARIMRLRKDKSLTQQELAERLGISQPVVSDYEHDVIGLDSDRIVQLASNWESDSEVGEALQDDGCFDQKPAALPAVTEHR